MNCNYSLRPFRKSQSKTNTQHSTTVQQTPAEQKLFIYTTCSISPPFFSYLFIWILSLLRSIMVYKKYKNLHDPYDTELYIDLYILFIIHIFFDTSGFFFPYLKKKILYFYNRAAQYITPHQYRDLLSHDIFF